VFAIAGDVLVTVKGNGVGKVNLGADAAIGRQLMAVRPDQENLDRLFLFAWMRAHEPEIAALGRGATVPGIGIAALSSLAIPLPPLREQRRIAAILDQADALRAKRRASLAKLDSLAQSIFLEMFGNPVTNPERWPVMKIGDLLESANYGSSKKAGEVGEYPILRMNNLTYEGQLDLTDLKHVDLSREERGKYMVRDGDVLFNRTNSAELVGKTAVFRGATAMAFAGYLIRLRPRQPETADYISAFLNSRCGKAVLKGMCKSIIGMANINAREVQAVSLPVPPLPLQRQFADSLVRIETTKQPLNLSQGQMNALFASLQHRAFRGEL
jgi:type I restriction enzyme S subunit